MERILGGDNVTTALRAGARVRVPWGLDEDRDAVVVEVWGDPAHPSHVRVELIPELGGDEAIFLLLNPNVVTPAPAA